MSKFRYVILYLFPIFAVMGVIFTASSQSYEEQDLRPLLNELTDRNRLLDLIRGIREEHAQNMDRLFEFVSDYPFIPIVVSLIVIVIVFVVFYQFMSLAKTKKGQWLTIILYLTSLLIFVSAMFVFLFHSEALIEIIRDRVSTNRIRSFLERLDFTYAGAEISVDTLGPEGYVEFVMRKFAHFFLYALLGFFIARAFLKANAHTGIAVIVSLLLVMIYATFDEFHQAFVPSRTPLMEDIFLDTAGGIFGISIAIILNSIINRFKNKSINMK